MGRDRPEIHKKITEALDEISLRAPSLRICQIIGNAIPAEELERRGKDIYYIEDEDLLKYLRDFEEFLIRQDWNKETMG